MMCKTCYYYKPSNLQGRGNCRVNPPVVQLMPAMMPPKESSVSNLALPAKASRLGGSAGGDMQIGVLPHSVLPTVLDNDFCQHFKAQTGTK